MKKSIIHMNVLSGEPTDGSGQVCVHLFVPDSTGPFTESSVSRLDKCDAAKGNNRLTIGPCIGRLACDDKKTRKVAPVTKGNTTTITPRTDDPRAVTCIKCISTEVYVQMMKSIDGITVES